jgi:hypothetical protein
LIVLVGSERIGALLRKEKDEASPPKLSLGGSSNSPPFLVCEVWRFFYFQKSSGFALVSQPQNRPLEKLFSRGQN